MYVVYILTSNARSGVLLKIQDKVGGHYLQHIIILGIEQQMYYNFVASFLQKR